MPLLRTYSYESAQTKVESLKRRGYHLIGELPHGVPIWSTLKSASFLFANNGDYYQCNARYLLTDNLPPPTFDENNRPLLSKKFKKILSENFIFVIHFSAGKALLLLRENAALSGHSFLIEPYQVREGTIVGGEVYYNGGHISLINHKSGSFRQEIPVALPIIKEVWGDKGIEKFYPALEKEEVARELEKRLAPLSSPISSLCSSLGKLEIEGAEQKSSTSASPSFFKKAENISQQAAAAFMPKP